jgi:hypothetical protein
LNWLETAHKVSERQIHQKSNTLLLLQSAFQ